MIESTNDIAKEDEAIEVKVKPPFPKIPSFILASFVLGYVGDDQICVSLLHMLSKNCRSYSYKHIDIMRTFLPPWTPCFSGQINFGSKPLSYT